MNATTGITRLNVLRFDQYGQHQQRERRGVEALLAHARAHLARHKCPKAIEVWPDLPKSGANKILRRTVRDRVIAAQGGQ